MKKNLLSIGLLLASLSVYAQSEAALRAEENVVVTLEDDALVYTEGSLETIGDSKIDNAGQVRITQGGFYTKEANEVANKVNGGNFVLQLTKTSVPFNRYGQLWIDNPKQGDITGVVDKEYRDVSHGVFQQLGLPFYKKTISDLNTEIAGLNLNDTRFSKRKATGTVVLKYNNAKVIQENPSITSQTVKGTDYYAIGTNGLKVDKGTYFSSNTFTIKGVPYASGIQESLTGAGAGINFGENGRAINSIGQRYNSYINDPWDISTDPKWTNNYARNIYQFSNPYLTNLDLTLLPQDTKTAIKGIRFDVTGSSINLSDKVATAKFINFTTTGAMAGDVAAIIKPMQEFTIKLNSNNPIDVDFDALRTFSFKPSNNVYGVTNNVPASAAKNALNATTESLKQLELIALDENKNELDRTYYVVYADGQSGVPINHSVQAAANNKNIIGTFEEKSSGGLDDSLSNTYWLYINEANEIDFKGKRIPLLIDSDKIKHIKISIRENMQLLSESNSTLSSGESFYVNLNNNIVKVSQGDILDIPSDVYQKIDAIGVYYGKPENETLSNVETISKPSETRVVWDDSDDKYKVIFDKNWKEASLKIFDLSGKLISSESKVKTSDIHTLALPYSVQTVYVVIAISETGQKYVQKIKTK